MDEHAVSVVVVTYWTGCVLQDCLRALLNCARVGEIIVVDNGNDEDSQKFLDELASVHRPKLHILRTGRNVGFAAACNMGAARTSCSHIALVNPDLIVRYDTFEKILDTWRERPDAAICGARLLNSDGSEQRGGRRDVLTPWRAFTEALRLDRLFPHHPHFRRLNMHETAVPAAIAEVPMVTGAIMVLPRRWWQELGGMDERIFLHLEDADICLRALERGGAILYRGDAPVCHYLSTSEAPRIFIEWHKTRSAVYYFRKHFSTTYPRWALGLVDLALWARFAVIFLRETVNGAKWLWRHRRPRGVKLRRHS